MGLLKPKNEKTDSISRKEFDALAGQLESFKKVATLAVAAIGLAMNGSPGLPDSNPRRRLELLAAVADLESEEGAELQDFFRLLATLDKAESARQLEEERKRRLPRTFDTVRVPTWRG